MKAFLPVLLAALLGVEQAHSLVCFSCTNQQSNFYCLKPTVCEDSDNYCVTVSAAAGIGNVVDLGYSLNKGCSPICPAPPGINIGVASVGTHCCQSFLCNISAAGGLRASASLLGLGLLLSLLALLRPGPCPPTPDPTAQEGKPSPAQTLTPHRPPRPPSASVPSAGLTPAPTPAPTARAALTPRSVM